MDGEAKISELLGSGAGAVQAWAAEQGVDRTEAVRRLVEAGLTSLGIVTSPATKAAAARLNKMNLDMALVANIVCDELAGDDMLPGEACGDNLSPFLPGLYLNMLVHAAKAEATQAKALPQI